MQSVKPNIQTFADPEHLAQAAIAQFVQLAEEAIAARGLFTVVLSAG